MFEFLFKYSRVAFQQGELSLAWPPWAVVAAVLLLVPGVLFLLRYRRPLGQSRWDRLILTALRAAALSVLLFCLLRPILRVSTVVPRRNFIGVLLDDSRSMRIADAGSGTRGSVLQSLLAGEGGEAGAGETAGPGEAGPGAEMGPLRRGLEERFQLRFFRFSRRAARIPGPESLDFSGDRTELAGALEEVLGELDGVPLSGLVVVTDGADNSDGTLTDALLALRSAGVPVHTVGLGRTEIRPDLELQRVELPRSVLHGSTVVADVVLAHRGLGGRSVRVEVEDDGRILGSREIVLPGKGESVSTQLQFTAEEGGARRLTFRATTRSEEAVAENNERELLLEVRDRRRKILYLEGEPRFEVKFLRRAVAGDPNLQLVVLLRSAENKFLRLDVDRPDELAGGFPDTREELFRYDGLILGSVEASFFTHDQLRMIGDFVSRRGGGLLLLGGRRALGEGGYAGTPLADLLPVRLPPPERGASRTPLGEPGAGSAIEESTANAGIEVPEAIETLKVELTPAGRRHPAVRLAESEEASVERWAALPPLSTPNRLGEVKPGAVTLLSGEPLTGGASRIVLAYQRFGRGITVAFPVQDSWMWQMHAEISVEDQTHETFWRQLLRWLVSGVPGRVEVMASEEQLPVGEPVTLRAEVEDARYLRVNGAEVVARVTSPTGLEQELPMTWTVRRDGEYEATFTPEENGVYTVRADVAGVEGGRTSGPGGESGSGSALASSGETHFAVGPAEREAFEAGMNAPLLQRIARETGGRFYTEENVASLPEEIVYTESGDTVVEERPLWDMPVLLLLLLGLVGGEWGYRRLRGMA